VFVFSDEGGAIQQDMFTAMEAVTTGSDSRAVVFGNPDYPSAYWKRFWDKTTKEGRTWNTFNISAYELPTLTGEVVYPDDPGMEARFRSAITSREWVENKEQIWQPTEARYLSKVMGQFPKEDDFAFFPQAAIDKTYATDLSDLSHPYKTMGVDIARYGQDETVIALNEGGRVRVADSWGKADLFASARRVHKFAVDNEVSEVRIDSSGIGGGVLDILLDDDSGEFAGSDYTLIGWDNGSSAPDATQHMNKRAYAHESLRSQMQDEQIDLEYNDTELREELQAITYKFSLRGALQITAKDEIKKGLSGRSPDRLDAVILAAVDMSPWTGNPLNEFKVGEKIIMDPSDVQVAEFGADYWYADNGRSF